MAAANYSSDVLQMFYVNQREPLQPERVVPYDRFLISQTNFQGWLHVWNMMVSEGNPSSKDLHVYERENKAKFTDVVTHELQKMKNMKVTFGLKVNFSREKDGKTQEKTHFSEKQNPMFSKGMMMKKRLKMNSKNSLKTSMEK